MKLKKVHSLEAIPEFAGEEEEARFWAEHGLGEALLEAMSPPPEGLLPPPQEPGHLPAPGRGPPRAAQGHGEEEGQGLPDPPQGVRAGEALRGGEAGGGHLAPRASSRILRAWAPVVWADRVAPFGTFLKDLYRGLRILEEALGAR